MILFQCITFLIFQSVLMSMFAAVAKGDEARQSAMAVGAPVTPGATTPRAPRLIAARGLLAPLAQALGSGRPPGQKAKDWQLELQGARASAEDWLQDTGFSLLEERDGDGHRTYSIVSGSLIDWPGLRVRAGVGAAEFSAGLRPRRNAPAVGVTIPWQRYSVEITGLDDRSFGYALVGAFRWSDPERRLQYGFALPLSLGQGPAVGALLQVRWRFD